MQTSSEAGVLKMAVVLVRCRRLIVFGVLITMFFTALVVLVIPVSYTATAVILAPQPLQTPASALLSQLGSLAALSSAGLESSMRSPEETYVGILSSRTIADGLILQFDLTKLYKRKSLVETRRALAHHTHIETTKGWLIRIEVNDHSAKQAADLANAYVDALYRTNQHLALTQASQRRIFLGQQVAAENEALSRAEVDFEHTQQSTGVIQLSGQAELTLRMIAQLRAELISRDLKLHELQSIATERNDNVLQMEAGIAALRDQLRETEEGANASKDTGYFLPAGKVPAAGLEYIRKARELRYHEALFETLSKEYEAARVDEANAPPLIQVVDRAIPSDKRAWPPRTLLVLLAGLCSLLLLSLFALGRDACMRAASDPANIEQVAILKGMLGRQRRSKSGIESVAGSE